VCSKAIAVTYACVTGVLESIRSGEWFVRESKESPEGTSVTETPIETALDVQVFVNMTLTTSHSLHAYVSGRRHITVC
jgi:hypothetical protein